MTYLFTCKACSIEFEVVAPHTELDNIKQCPHCNSENIERVYSPTISVWKCDGNYGKTK